jgi:hypothetical protein
MALGWRREEIDDFGFWILEGRDDPAVVVRDSQRMINPNRRGRFSLRRERLMIDD